MSKRKDLMAVLDATLRQLNGWDEMDAEGNAVKRVLETTQAELVQTQARLETSKAEFAKAVADHAHWREISAREQAAGNARVDILHGEISALEQQVAERRAELDNILAGMAALSQRLRG
jgi:hypothetical protein